MPRILYTVQNLLDEVRSQIDETNVDSVSDSDILNTLNRGQDYAFDILARRYPEPILRPTSLALTNGTKDYDIPEDVFEDRVLKLEIEVPQGNTSTFIEVQQVSFKDMSNYESASNTNVPLYYCIYSRKIRFSAAPTGTYGARIWSLRSPEKLVKPQGRVTLINESGNYLIVDSVGDSLTTEADQLGSYVNLIDGQTGEVKGSVQIQIITSGGKVTFRSSPTRTTVLNRTIDTDITDLVNQDDYLSPIDGTCVPYFGRPTSNFLIEFAAAELIRKLGGDSASEEKVLEKFERQLEKNFAGRPVTSRIQKRSRVWGMPIKRYYWE